MQSRPVSHDGPICSELLSREHPACSLPWLHCKCVVECVSAKQSWSHNFVPSSTPRGRLRRNFCPRLTASQPDIAWLQNLLKGSKAGLVPTAAVLPSTECSLYPWALSLLLDAQLSVHHFCILYSTGPCTFVQLACRDDFTGIQAGNRVQVIAGLPNLGKQGSAADSCPTAALFAEHLDEEPKA